MAADEGGDERRDKENHHRRAAVLHPLRRQVLRLLGDGDERGVAEIAVELDRRPARIAHHVRILTRRGALEVVPRCRPNPPLFRQAPDVEWARKMLDEIDDQDSGQA